MNCPFGDDALKIWRQIVVEQETRVDDRCVGTQEGHASPKTCLNSGRHERGFSQTCLIREEQVALPRLYAPGPEGKVRGGYVIAQVEVETPLIK